MSYTCAGCGKQKDGLKICAKCHSVRYCSRDCQKVDWKAHRKVCSQLAACEACNGDAPTAQAAAGNNGTTTAPAVTTTMATNSTSPATGSTGGTKNAPLPLDTVIDKPFRELNSKTWLHGRTEMDVYKLLIDTFRLRLDDDKQFDGKIEPDTVYNGDSTSLPAFRRFLSHVERKRALLPPWWNDAKRDACVEFGTKQGWSSLKNTVEKSVINKHYESANMGLQMRILGEQIYGHGPGGQSSAQTLKGMVYFESSPGMFAETMDIEDLRRHR